VIVVGVDYSDDARAALRWAEGEAAMRGTPLTAVHVGPPVYDLVAHTPYAEERRAALLPTLVAFVRETLGDSDVTTSVVDGPPAEGLVGAGALAELLVLGRHGAGAVKRLIMGSTTNDVVRAAPCPVAVVPPGTRDAVARRIVTGTDGSSTAAAAVAWAVAEAVRRRVPLTIVHAAPPPVVASAVPGAAVPYTDETARAFLADVVTETRAAAGGDVEGALSWQQPAAALLDAAGSADLLVVGAHGDGALARFLLGSTTTAVVQRSRCPVVVIPGERT